jgi:hypothetical protein
VITSFAFSPFCLNSPSLQVQLAPANMSAKLLVSFI